MPRKKAPGVSGFHSLMNQYRQNAKAKTLPFSLSEPEFRALTSSHCHYCGSPPTRKYVCSSRRTAAGQAHSAYLYNGVDRIVNTQGYVLSNCLPCCKTCNHAKHTMSYADFVAWLDVITKFRASELDLSHGMV